MDNLKLTIFILLASFCADRTQTETTKSSVWTNEAETRSEPQKIVVTANLATKQSRYKLTIMPIHFTSKIKMSDLKQQLLKSFKNIEIANENEVKDVANESASNNKNSSSFHHKTETSIGSPKTYLLRISPKHYRKSPSRIKRNPTEDASVEELNEFFANLRDNDDDTCLARMVCEMATGNPSFGQFGHDITEVLLSLESDDPHAPWKYYKQAALIGRRARTSDTCARRYQVCRASSEDLVSVSRCLEQGEHCFDQ